jgi:hypothetical protein
MAVTEANPPEQRTMVVFDTNQLFGGGVARATSALRTPAAKEHLELAVPEVVVRELVAQHRDKLERIDEHFDADWDRLTSPVSGPIVALAPRSAQTLDQRVAEFEINLRARLASLDIAVLPLPDNAVQLAHTRAVAPRRPFEKARDGRITGLRDALIGRRSSNRRSEAGRSSSSAKTPTSRRSQRRRNPTRRIARFTRISGEISTV